MSKRGLSPELLQLLELPDMELGIRVWAAWVDFQAMKRGIATEDISPQFAEDLRVATLGLDTKEARNVVLEKILRSAAMGDVGTAGKLYRETLDAESLRIAALDEAVTGRRRQTAAARKDRSDPLQRLIIRILRDKPAVNRAKMLALLARERDVIDEITQDEIFFKEKGVGGFSAPISGLKDRMSRARKKIRLSL